MRRALITGISGQDGYYLARLLRGKGYEVYGIDRRISAVPPDLSGILSGAEEIDLSEGGLLGKFVSRIRPLEIYYLAAHHFSSQSGENRTGRVSPFLEVNVMAPNEVLEVMKEEMRDSRFFYAASSHIFGSPFAFPQNEETPYRPDTPYAISKSTGVHLCRYYRKTHRLHAVSGILYNHESPRRAESFITVQIARAAALASRGQETSLYLKDLNAVADWGAAEDYVDAMWRTLQLPAGDEYVISTGIPRTVMDFAREAFAAVGLRAENHVFQAQEAPPGGRVPYVGDNAKIRRMCGWQPQIPFESMVRRMVESQLASLPSE